MRVVVVIAVSVGSLGGPPVAQAFLGASAADLVYTPVPPCRIIDTRVAGAGGALVPGVPRDFLVSGTVNFPGQGGHAGGCGIPEGATGAMLNFVAVNPGGSGNLRAWAWGQAAPSASIVNYAAVAGLNLANEVAVPLCNPAAGGCTFDVSVQADVNGTHLVVDVLGFLQSTAPRGAIGAANTFLGVNAGNFTTTGVSNTATGARALQSNTTGASNTAVGAGALVNNTAGGGNTATGFGALASNTTGLDNAATGYEALASNTTGRANTATGVGALRNNTTSIDNTASGAYALEHNTTGNYNTAIGADSLRFNTTGVNNTATGNMALQNNTTGGASTATGFGALRNNTTGTNNTAVGNNALLNNTSGSSNIALGDAAGSMVTGNSNIDIGNAGVAGDSGIIRIGSSNQTRTFIAGIRGAAVAGPGVLVDANGQLGVSASTRRVKDEIRDMGEASRGLLQLRPVTFRYTQALADGARPLQYGLIAEEVAEVYPELVAHDPKTGEPQTVLYHVLPSLLLNELQQQQRQLETQATQIEAQAAQLKSLRARLTKLEAALAGPAGPHRAASTAHAPSGD